MKKCICSIVTAVLVGTVSHGQIHTDAESSIFNANKPEKLEWLKDAGFGMFIHFGIDSQLGVVISHSLVGASEDYIDRYVNELPKTFNPSALDADKIAELARITGMKYVVFTTKHHSGFCFWDTETTDFNIMNTPYGRDFLAEYVEAVRKAGLKVGFYYSPEDFLFTHEQGLDIRRQKLVYNDEQRAAFDNLVERQCTELMTKYGQIDVMFIDGSPVEKSKEVFWKLQPDILITRGAISTPEQRLNAVASAEPWEACLTLGTQWQYKPSHDDRKTPDAVIKLLIETRAKGGALLLNIGPRPDGSIAEADEDCLRNIAAWYFVNHEAVDNVRPWIICNEDDIWFSKAKDEDTVYAYLTNETGWHRGSRRTFILGSVEATPSTRISVLGHGGRIVEYDANAEPAPRFEQKDDGLHISVTRSQRLYNNHQWPHPIVVKLEHVKAALVPPVVETKSAKLIDGATLVTGELIDDGGAANLMIGIEYQQDKGFAENVLNTEWTCTPLVPIEAEGAFGIKVPDLQAGKTYIFRAIIKHPKLTVKGDVVKLSL